MEYGNGAVMALQQKSIHTMIGYGKCISFAKIVRTTAILSTLSHIAFFLEQYYGNPWQMQEHPANPIWLFAIYCAQSVILNFGFYFITTEISRRHRVLSTFLYLPSIFILPFVNGYILGLVGFDYGVMTVFAWSLFIYYRFNPWRKMIRV